MVTFTDSYIQTEYLTRIFQFCYVQNTTQFIFRFVLKIIAYQRRIQVNLPNSYTNLAQTQTHKKKNKTMMKSQLRLVSLNLCIIVN